jgi:hypothetical protein
VVNALSVVAPVVKAVNIVQPSVGGLSVAKQVDQVSSDIPTRSAVSSSASVTGAKETLTSLTSRLDRLSDLFIASLPACINKEV